MRAESGHALCEGVSPTCEKMAAVLPHLQSLGVQAPGALVGLGAELLPHCLDVLAVVGVQEDHHGVVLDVVQPLHCSGRDVQQGVFVLRERKDDRRMTVGQERGSCFGS